MLFSGLLQVEPGANSRSANVEIGNHNDDPWESLGRWRLQMPSPAGIASRVHRANQESGGLRTQHV